MVFNVLLDHLRLLSHVKNAGGKKGDEVWYSTCTDNYLSVFGSSGSDVFQEKAISAEQNVFLEMQFTGQSPSSFKLEH